VLSRTGHSKPVDIWSVGIITYVMLCGYAPFRSEDPKDIVAETQRGRIEFHDRYWKNISQEAKDFILSLLKTVPQERLTAGQAMASHWLTVHAPSTEHDISSGIRDNFSPRKKWQSAVSKLRAASRLNSGGIALREREAMKIARSEVSGGSGGWGHLVSDDEDTDKESQEVHSPLQNGSYALRRSPSPTTPTKPSSVRNIVDPPPPIPGPRTSPPIDRLPPISGISNRRTIPGSFDTAIYYDEPSDGVATPTVQNANSPEQETFSLRLAAGLKKLILG